MKIKLLTIKDLQKKSETELKEYIEETKAVLGQLYRDILANKDKQTHQVAQLKKSIARAKTLVMQSSGEDK